MPFVASIIGYGGNLRIFASVKGFSGKHKIRITFLNQDLERRPVSYDASMPAPLPPKDALATIADKVEKDSDRENTACFLWFKRF